MWVMIATVFSQTVSAAPPAQVESQVGLQVDLHLDTPTQLLSKGIGLDAPEGLEAGLAQLRAGGTNVAVMVLWPPRKTDHRARALKLLSLLEAELERLPDQIGLARSPGEARALAEAGRVAMLISMEGAHGLGTDPDWLTTLDTFHQRGMGLLGLTWSFSNRFAGSSADGGEGLTEEGRALVAEARRRGIVLDVSHASRQTTMEVCADAPAPVIASHSDAWAIKKHSRNLTDDEIRCIAATGGVIGLNFHATFVGPEADVGKVADHADHLAAVGGHGVVALGSDFDGYIKKPAGLPDAAAVGALWEALAARGWTEAQIAGVRGENFLRAWQGVVDAAG